MDERRLLESVHEWLDENSMVILKAGQEVLAYQQEGDLRGTRRWWWWNDEVKDAIRAKKKAKKNRETSGRQEDGDS